MADRDRATLVVAVAGIAATALVGLAGASAAWLNARDDRAAQGALVRDQLTYERRTSVYLDAIELVEDQKRSWDQYGQPFFNAYRSGVKIPYVCCATQRLTTRLRVFGSTRALKAFQKTQALNESWGFASSCCITRGDVADIREAQRFGFEKSRLGSADLAALRGREYLNPVKPGKKLEDEPKLDKQFYDGYHRFTAQVSRFEDIVHGELGV
jgi:hypothetical protein